MILQRKRSQFFLFSFFVLILFASHATEKFEKGENENNEKEDCPICLTAEGNLDYQWPTCSHKFHKNCVKEWEEVSNKCPVCRTANGESPKQFGFDDEELRSRNDHEAEFFENLLSMIRDDIQARVMSLILNPRFQPMPNIFSRNQSFVRADENEENANFRRQPQQYQYSDLFTENFRCYDNVAKPDECELCEKLIPFQTGMCETCAKVTTESLKSSSATNHALEDVIKEPEWFGNRNSKIQRNEENDSRGMQMRDVTFSNVLNPNSQPHDKLNEHREGNQRNEPKPENVDLKSQECAVCLEDVKIETPHFKAACGHLIHSQCVNRPRRCCRIAREDAQNQNAVNPLRLRIRSVINEKKNGAAHTRGKKQEGMDPNEDHNIHYSNEDTDRVKINRLELVQNTNVFNAKRKRDDQIQNQHNQLNGSQKTKDKKKTENYEF